MILESIKTVLKEFANNKLRTVLTMLGIIIGITSVTIVFSVSTGMRNMGENVLGQVTIPLTAFIHGDIDRTTFDAILDEINTYIDDTDTINSLGVFTNIEFDEYNNYLKEKYTEEELEEMFFSSDVTPVDKNYFEFLLSSSTNPIELVDGRLLSSKDFNLGINYALIREDIARDLYGSSDLIGKEIEINNQVFQVIGIMDATENELGYIPNPAALIPFDYYYYNMMDKTGMFSLFIMGDKDADYKQAEKDIKKILLDYLEEDEFNTTVITSEDLIDNLESVVTIINLIFGGIASLSILVGGIGIMNIMLVSVSERVKETGLRMAIGAKNSDIIIQFLIEGILLTVISGIIGLLLAWLGTKGINMIIASNTEANANGMFSLAINISTTIKIILFCGLLGIIFGIYPAIKASKLDPVEALKYE